MNVLIIGFSKIAYMPYMNFYIDKLIKSNSNISLVYWDRDSSPDIKLTDRIKSYCFKENMLDSEPIHKKIPFFIKFRSFAIKVIKKNKLDLIIVLHSTPGVLLSDVLTTTFKGRYILDYRDFTYENINIYKKVIHKLIGNSLTTFVSSKGYLKFLPDSDKIVVSHNLSLHSNDERSVRRELDRESHPIRIRFWGFIRHAEINMKIINQLGNDCRFELHYHGREQKTGQLLRNYVEKNQIKNIFFHGQYKPHERVDFASKTDLLHNIYENDIKTIYAMGNKYYDGLTFYLPQLCNEGSFMGQEVELNRNGIMLNPYECGLADAIYNYYKAINWNEFNEKCDERLAEITDEYNNGYDVLEEILQRKR